VPPAQKIALACAFGRTVKEQVNTPLYVTRRYRRSGIFGRDDNQLGGVPVALTLGQLWHTLRGRFSMYDAARCTRGLDCLRSYCAEWDENLRTFKRTPKHDWASHGADAFRYLAMAWREPMQAEDEKPDPIKELLKPKTLDQVWEEYTHERIDAGGPHRLVDAKVQLKALLSFPVIELAEAADVTAPSGPRSAPERVSLGWRGPNNLFVQLKTTPRVL
jgi:hypothetical protein